MESLGLVKILWDIAELVGVQGALRKLLEGGPAVMAIDATIGAFPAVEGLREHLCSWIQSQEFADILTRMQDGDGSILENHLVESFVQTTNFYIGDQTDAVAREVLEAFLKELREALYSGERGLAMYAARDEVLHRQTQELVSDTADRTSGEIAALRADMRALRESYISPDDAVGHEAAAEKVLHARIDEARLLILEGKVRTAQSRLASLRAETERHPASAEVRFRIATNLGSCALELTDFDTARSEFKAALRLQPERAKALANAALGELLGGDTSQALSLASRARQVDPADSHAAAVYLQVLDRLDKLGEIEHVLSNEAWMSSDPNCALTLGLNHMRRGEYEAAEKSLRVTVASEPNNWKVYSLMSEAIFRPIQAALQGDPPLPWRMPVEVKARLEEAEGCLGNAIDVLEHSELREPLCDALAYRANLRGLLGRHHDALRDCEHALSRCAHHDLTLLNKGLVLSDTGEFPEAVECFESIADEELRSSTRTLLAHAYIETRRSDDAVELIAPFWRPLSGDPEQIDLARLLLRAYRELGRQQEVNSIVQSLREVWPSDPDALSALADELWEEGKPSEAIEVSEAALASSTSRQRERIVLQLADLKYSQREFGEAANLYAGIVDTTLDNPVLRRYISSLYNSGAYGRALSLAQSLTRSGEAIPVITEVEALILEVIQQDLPGARNRWARLARVEPAKAWHRIRVASIDVRTGQWDQARGVIAGIGLSEIRDDAEVLIAVANLRALLGMPDVLAFVYRARSVRFEDPDVQMAYLWHFMAREAIDKELLSPDQVGPECTVHLRRNDETKVFTITNDKPLNLPRGERSPDDTLAIALLGHRKGDTIVLKKGPLEELSYEVADIQSKYVCAFLETIENFSTWFAEYDGFYRLDASQNPLSRMQALADKDQEVRLQVAHLYEQRRLPLSLVARLLGKPLVDVWAGTMVSADRRLLAALGSIEQKRSEAEWLANAKNIILDLTALLTLAHLGLLDRLPKAFGEILVPQAVLDDINDAIAKDLVGPIAAGFFGKDGDRYVYDEVTSVNVEHRKRFLEGIREFIESYARRPPMKLAVEFDRAKLVRLEQILGRSGAASVLLSKEYGGVLYSDDLGLRSIAKREMDVENIWTQSILSNLRERDFLTEEEYHQAIARLVLGNYHFVSVDATDILWVLEQHQMSITRDVLRMLDVFRDPNLTEASSIGIMADVVKLVWLKAPLVHQKMLVLDAALSAFTDGRDVSAMTRRLKAALVPRLQLMPLAQLEVPKGIDSWTQRRLLVPQSPGANGPRGSPCPSLGQQRTGQ